MAIFYRDVADTINKTKFELRVPDTYEPKLPGYYRKFPERRPVYNASTPNTFTMMTIANMVEMATNDISFTIVKREDVLIIVDTMQDYVQKMRRELKLDDLPDHDPVKVFVINVEITLSKMCDTHDVAQAQVAHERPFTPLKTFGNLFSGLFGLE